ncbi:gem-associated protein 7-like [Anticarsia gemmatalis]|uniref:gem-associated protein 7-like n=1 Tax=Anticarsia gemmatalis TaxID=129554 RepID=UPI003F7657D4
MVSPDMEENDDKLKRQQKARAALRESFLKATSELYGKPCSILTYEQTSLYATFSGMNPDGSEFLVRELDTPSGIKMDSALLRSSDVLAIQFNDPVQLP